MRSHTKKKKENENSFYHCENFTVDTGNCEMKNFRCYPMYEITLNNILSIQQKKIDIDDDGNRNISTIDAPILEMSQTMFC